jgi:hypothetical protein
MRGAVALAVLTVVTGGLLLAGASTASWVVEERTRDVGGVALEDVETIPGVDVAPQLVPLGLVTAVAGLAAVAVPRRARRLGGVVVAGLAAVGLAVAGWGLLEASRLDGNLGGGPALALIGGALALAGGGLLARGPAAPELLDSERYSVEGAQSVGDDEWRLASMEEDPE